MATIMHLPDEVIVIILKNKSISIKNILNLKSTCKRFAQITLSNEFWKEKYCQRCSTAAKRYKKLKKSFNHLNIEEQVKSGIQCIKKLQHYVLLMSSTSFSETDKEQLNCLLHRIVENSIIYYFVWDELNRFISVCVFLESLLKSTPELYWEFNPIDLKHKHCFGAIFYCLKKYRFLYKQFKFLNKPKEKQIAERQLLIVAQYFVPYLPYSVINTWLDGITQEVLSRLKHKYPMHSIFSIPLEQFSFWGDNNISENFWNPTEASQIIRIIGEYIFSELEIHKLYELWMTSNLEVELNKQWIENSIFGTTPVPYHRIILTIIYFIVTRRFGIKDFILNLKVKHILEHTTIFQKNVEIQLIWKPKYKIDLDFAEILHMPSEADIRLYIRKAKCCNVPFPNSLTFDYLGHNKINFSIFFEH